MSFVERLLRENIRALKPYSSARDEYSGAEGIFLDANENAFGSAAATALNRYPDPLQRRVKQNIGEIKNISPDQIFLGNGSDEAIDLLIRAFCEPGRERILMMPPTYGMYEVCAAVNNVEVVHVPLSDSFEMEPEKILSAFSPAVKLFFICSPNNPTGNVFDPEAIETILRNFAGLVVIDEAYIDFCPNYSWLPRLSQFENLVVLQTFSKAWGLANIRLGMAFGAVEIINVLNRIKFPYNVSGVTQEITLHALENMKQKERMVAQIVQQRKVLQEELEKLPYVEKIYPSEANFLLVKMRSAGKIYRRLLEDKIIVRDRSRVIRCEDCLRITVGTPEENKALIETLLKI